MRKILILVALAFLSIATFAQVKQSKFGLQSVKVLKHINNLPSGAKTVVDSIHYDGENAYAIGTNDESSTLGAYVFFPAAYTLAHHVAGNAVTSVKVYINGVANVTSATLNIFSDQGITALASQEFTPIEGWNEITLTTPLPIPDADMYVGYTVVTTGGYPLGCDSITPAVSNTNWIISDGTWKLLSDLPLTIVANWNIRAMVSGNALTSPVAFCTQNSWNTGDVALSNSLISPIIYLENVGVDTLTVSGVTGLSAPYTITLIPATVSLTAGQSVAFTFSFAPTVAGVANQTATITTNVGNITFTLTGNGFECPAITSLPYNQGFEDSTACIRLVDANADESMWSFVNSSALSHSGASHARYSYNTDGLTAGDDWLILPGIQFTAGTTYKVVFWHKVYDALYPESFKVAIGNTSSPASLTTTLINLTLQTDTVWKGQLVNFAVPATDTYYIGFHCYSQADEWRLAIDDITVDFSNGISENATEVVSVFPNPANDKLYIAANQVNSVEIYNLTGAKVASFGNQNIININDLAQGTYLVKVITDNKVTTQKINIVR